MTIKRYRLLPKQVSRRVARTGAAVFLASAGVVGFWPAAHAGADAPDGRGYWAEAAQSGGVTQPTAPSGAPAAPPSFVPSNGLYVAYSPEAGPTAISAVHFNIGDERSGLMVLRVHDATNAVTVPPPPDTIRDTEGSLPGDATTTTTTNPPPNTVVAHVAACVTTSTWKPTQPNEVGAWPDRPAYDTDKCVIGNFSTDGYTVSFDVGPFLQKSTGVYDFAIVPDPGVRPLTPDTTTTSIDPNASSPSVNPPNNTPFQISFEEPGEEALQLEDLPGDDEAPPPVEDVVTDTPPEAPSALPVGPGTFPAIDVPTTAPVPVRPRVRVNRGNLQPAAVGFPGDGRGQRIMAVILLLGLAAAWWWVGGAESRGPRLLGSLAGDSGGVVPGGDRKKRADGERVGGIGRFSRARSGRPRRLI
jgi:hypothetical protein